MVAPEMTAEIDTAAVTRLRRPFEPADVDGAWLVVTAATPEVNREVARIAEGRSVFVNAVDDPPNATAYLGGVDPAWRRHPRHFDQRARTGARGPAARSTRPRPAEQTSNDG